MREGLIHNIINDKYDEYCRYGAVGAYDGMMFADDVEHLPDGEIKQYFDRRVTSGNLLPRPGGLSKDISARRAAAHGVALQTVFHGKFGIQADYVGDISLKEAIVLMIECLKECAVMAYTDFRGNMVSNMQDVSAYRAVVERMGKALFEQTEREPLPSAMLELMPELGCSEPPKWTMEFSVPYNDKDY